MNRADHYLTAQRLLEQAKGGEYGSTIKDNPLMTFDRLVALAQVHATLATAVEWSSAKW